MDRLIVSTNIWENLLFLIIFHSTVDDVANDYISVMDLIWDTRKGADSGKNQPVTKNNMEKMTDYGTFQDLIQESARAENLIHKRPKTSKRIAFLDDQRVPVAKDYISIEELLWDARKAKSREEKPKTEENLIQESATEANVAKDKPLPSTVANDYISIDELIQEARKGADQPMNEKNSENDLPTTTKPESLWLRKHRFFWKKGKVAAVILFPVIIITIRKCFHPKTVAKQFLSSQGIWG